jgi:conjugal transfer pilus assembly protein TraI
MPVSTSEEILAGAGDKIRRLAEIAGGSASEFERLYIQPLRNLAHQIQLLPATPYSHYSGPAGLFNMCLDVGLMARQAAEGKIFVPEATIEVRHHSEGAWRYSAFLAGLLCQLHVPVGLMTVRSASGEQWPRYNMAVTDWVKDRGLNRYYITWHEKARVTGAEGASLLAKVVPAEVMDWLATTDSQTIRDITIACTREMSSSESILGAIVKSVTARVKEVDALHSPARFGRLTIGTQFEPHFLNAIRELIESGVWTVNQTGSKVFWGSDGLYVAWPLGTEEVVGIFEKRSLDGMPRSSVTLAELLGLSGVVIGKDTGVWVHDIVVTAKNGDALTCSAMRFKDPAVLLGHLPITPLTTPFGKVLVDAQAEQIALAGAARSDTPAKATVAAKPAPIPAPLVEPSAAAHHSDAVQPPKAADPLPVVSEPKSASTSQSKIPNRSAAVLEHVDEIMPGERLPQEVLARLKIKPTDIPAIALGMALKESLQYRGDRVRTLPWGVAICCKWLTEVAGYPVSDLVTPLDRSGVIAKAPDSKDLALVSKVVFSDSTEPRLAVVLKLDFAAKVGMPIDGKV